jgi:hypothetical protein
MFLPCYLLILFTLSLLMLHLVAISLSGFLVFIPFLWFAPLHGFIPPAFSSPCCTIILLFPYYGSVLLSWFWSCLSGCSCTLFYSCLIFLNRLQCLHHCSLPHSFLARYPLALFIFSLVLQLLYIQYLLLPEVGIPLMSSANR